VLRKLIAVAAALAVASTGVSAASGSSEPAAGAAPVSIVRDAIDCGGPGFSKVFSTSGNRLSMCVHTAHDQFDALAGSSARAVAVKPATAPVKCYGDGQTGPRVQMIYGYHDGLPNRSRTVVAQVQREMAPRMQAVVKAQSLGQDLGIRFAFTKGCKAIDVKVIKFPRSVQYATNPVDPAGQLHRMADYLEDKGYNRQDWKYQVLWDGWNGRNGGGACGIAQTYPIDPVTSAPISPLNEGLPTLAGRTDPGTVTRPATSPVFRSPIVNDIIPLHRNFAANVSIVWNHFGGIKGPSCFNLPSLSRVTTQLHELFHNLGAVQLDAPHADTGHCFDAPSVMCPGDLPGYGGGISNKICRNVLVETLDCGMDDYWNPSPRAGSYLSTHLNVANSQYFGPQPQDLLVTSPV